jgi:hypothetical protein
LLFAFAPFHALHSKFVSSEFNETGKATTYFYFHSDVIPTSPLMEKVFGTRYFGKRHGSLVVRVSKIRDNAEE